MSFFEKIYQQFFSSPPQTPVRLVLKRKDSEMKSYRNWLLSHKYIEIMSKIEQAYQTQKSVDMDTEPNIFLLNSPQAKGFAIVYDKKIMGRKSLQFLMEYFKEKTTELGYVVKNAEKRLNDKKNYVETVEKYYLKPSIKISTENPEKANQLYGNISLENIWRDNKPNMLKVLVTVYSDHLFTEALEYDDYINHLFK